MKKNTTIALAILFLSLITNSAFANKAKLGPALQAVIQEILQNRKAGSYKNFSVKDCPKHKVDWVKIILKRQKQTLTYNFAKECDLDGTVEPQVLEKFPLNFRLRNLDEFNSIKGEAKLSPTIASRPLLRLDLANTEMSSPKENIKFRAYYEAEIDPFSSKVVGKHLGGKIFIEEINGKKINEEYPLPAAQSK